LKEHEMIRFDDRARSERYFTATLLPLLLFHDNMRGLHCFIDLIEKKVKEKARVERSGGGAEVERSSRKYDLNYFEVITEFHIQRDFRHYAHLTSITSDDDVEETWDVPDLVIATKSDLFVCEAKFFDSKFNLKDFNTQLDSQRIQVRRLLTDRKLTAYRHVAILPDHAIRSEQLVDLHADGLLTWSDIRKLAKKVMGSNHYVTNRLRNAIKRHPRSLGKPGIPNYDDLVSLGGAKAICSALGNDVQVGHNEGAGRLGRYDLKRLKAKPRWKLRYSSKRALVREYTWIYGAEWLRMVGEIERREAREVGARKEKYYDGILSFGELVEICSQHGDQILVGSCQTDFEQLTKRRWEWRSKSEAGGVVPGIWIGGTSWLRIIEEIQRKQ
jgi:hypothetical protein